jgi:hypothetical protein
MRNLRKLVIADQRRRKLARETARPRRAIAQTRPALLTPAPQPAPDRSLCDAGGLGRRRHTPALLTNPLDQQPAAIRTGAGITVKLHPVSSLELVVSQLPASKGARMSLPTNVLRNYS